MSDDELDAAARAVLEICREGDALPPTVRAAVWQRLEHELAPAPVVRTSRWIWIGVAAAAATILTLALGRELSTRDDAAIPELAPLQGDATTSPQRVESAAPPEHAPEPAVLPGPVDEPLPAEATRAASATTTHERAASSSSRTPRAAPDQRGTVPTASGASELELVREATAATRRGEPTRALALLDEAARRFGEGALLPERAAARVLALCADAQRAQARREADAFVARWPDSPLAARVRRACADDVTDGSGGGL